MKYTFKSQADKINKELEKAEKESRENAARALGKKLKKEVLSLYGTGDLSKGSGAIERRKQVTKVGFKKPAYHAHLIEYGTDERFVKNYLGTKGKEVSVGKMPERPFFSEFIEREAESTGRLMQKTFVKGFM